MFPHGTPVPTEWWEDALDRVAQHLSNFDGMAALAALGMTAFVVMLAVSLTSRKTP